MPEHLINDVICHGLLHLVVPTHTREYHLFLSKHIPDWQDRERELASWGMALTKESRPSQEAS